MGGLFLLELMLTTHFLSFVYGFVASPGDKTIHKTETTMLPQAKTAMCVSPTF